MKRLKIFSKLAIVIVAAFILLVIVVGSFMGGAIYGKAMALETVSNSQNTICSTNTALTNTNCPRYMVTPDLILTATNELRTNNHLTPLKYNKLLENSARLKARDMVDKDYFEHKSPSGVDYPFWFERSGYTANRRMFIGENLAEGYLTTQETMDAWEKSPEHMENILGPKFTEIGVALEYRTRGGWPLPVYVVHFGGRL